MYKGIQKKQLHSYLCCRSFLQNIEISSFFFKIIGYRCYAVLMTTYDDKQRHNP